MILKVAVVGFRWVVVEGQIQEHQAGEIVVAQPQPPYTVGSTARRPHIHLYNVTTLQAYCSTS